MNKDKKIRLLLIPLIFTVLLFVPAMIVEIASESIDVFMQEIPDALRIICMCILFIAMLIWCVLFLHIPIGVYIAILVIYSCVSWTWILRRKKWNVLFLIVWIVLCVLSILMYWKLSPHYYSMINR